MSVWSPNSQRNSQPSCKPSCKNESLIFWALILYSIATLTSMAGMSIGVGFLIVATLWVILGATPWTSCFKGRCQVSVAFPLLPIQNLQITHLFYASLFLAGACFVSLALAQLSPLQFAGQSSPVHLVSDSLKIWYLFLPFWLFFLFVRLQESRLRQILNGWLVAAGVMSILAIVQFYTGFPRPQQIPALPGRFHATLFFGHHLSTASILIFPFFVALSMSLAKAKSNQTLLTKLSSFALVILIGLALFLTWSRMLWLALPLGIFIVCLRGIREYEILGIGGVLLGVLFGLSKLPFVRYRFSDAVGTYERIDLWKANWYFFTQRPLFGIGWRKAEGLTASYFKEIDPQTWTQRFVGHAHNNFLEMLSGVGIVGTLLWLYWNYLVFKMAFQGSRRRDLWGSVSWGIFCAWCVFHLNGLTQVNFWEGKVLHQMMFATGLLLFCVETQAQGNTVQGESSL